MQKLIKICLLPVLFALCAIASQAQAVNISVNAFSGEENRRALRVEVRLSAPIAVPVTVNYATTDGTARAGEDYIASSGTVTVPAGQRFQTFDITVIDDDIYECGCDETLFINISNPSVGTITQGTATMRIADDERRPTAFVNMVAEGLEGNAGQRGNISFTVTLSSRSVFTSEFSILTMPNGTATPDVDYEPRSTISTAIRFSVPPLTRTATFSLPVIIGDNQLEPDETINLFLNPGANMDGNAGRSFTGVILDDDAPAFVSVLKFAPHNISASEHAGFATVTVNRTNNLFNDIAVDYETVDDFNLLLCANRVPNQRCDYTLTRGTLRFASGETQKTFTVPIVDDMYPEAPGFNSPNEAIAVRLVNLPANAIVGGLSEVARIFTTDGKLLSPNAGQYTAGLTPEQAGGGSTTASLFASVTLNQDETAATISVSSFFGAFNPFITLNGPAYFGETGPVIAGNSGVPAEFTVFLTPLQVQQLKAGLLYLTATDFFNNPVRGQIIGNPLEDPRRFVRQHFLDFLNRTPDAATENLLFDQLRQCGTDVECLRNRRIEVSSAFFEGEYNDLGSYILRLNKLSFGENPNYRMSYAQFMPARARAASLGGVAAGQANYLQNLLNSEAFTTRYPANMGKVAFVDAILENVLLGTGYQIRGRNRAKLIVAMNHGGREQMLNTLLADEIFRALTQHPTVALLQVFGYQRRDPNEAEYQALLTKLGQTGRISDIVCAALTSQDYQERFSLTAPRNSSECPQ